MAVKINTVGIVGAGTMGQGIALSCALAGYSVLLFDSNEAANQKAIRSIEKAISHLIQKGKLSIDQSAEVVNRIKPITQVSLMVADLIIEAIVEKAEAKQQLFLMLEEINSTGSIFCSNTSSISITKIAKLLKYPSRFAGLHFFNPAHLMKLVEVISGKETNQQVADVLKSFVKSLGKIPVEAKDSPGFIVNRVARHYYVEALKLAEDGVAPIETIDRLTRASGFKMGPFELMDLIGIDINYSVTESVYEGFGRAHKFRPSKLQLQKVKAGELGKKAGKGFYSYEK